MAYTLVDPTDEVALKRVSWKGFPLMDVRKRPLPSGVEVTETPPWEAKQMARTLDFQKRKADPTYQGAFHEKKRKSGKAKSKKLR